MSVRKALQDLVLRAEAGLDRPFGAAWNPLRQLGTLAFFYYWVCAASGIYLYILFDTSVTGVYASIERLTHDQWYLGGVMRSLHRYSSDAMVLLAVLHLGREFLFDRYRGVRWYAWFTGVAVLWFLYMSGISGYWLVWDQLAQYVATGSMEWLDWLGIVGQPAANNFLTRGSLTDRFFSLLIFIHIFVPLFLLFVMWVHVMRVAHPRINPPRGLAAVSSLALLALSLRQAGGEPPARRPGHGADGPRPRLVLHVPLSALRRLGTRPPVGARRRRVGRRGRPAVAAAPAPAGAGGGAP